MIPNVPKSSLFYYIYDMDTENPILGPNFQIPPLLRNLWG